MSHDYADKEMSIFWPSPMLSMEFERPSLDPDWWASLVDRYTAEMRTSFKRHRNGWMAAISQDRTLVCRDCDGASRCHRRVLAGILVKCGATYIGERNPAWRGTPARS